MKSTKNAAIFIIIVIFLLLSLPNIYYPGISIDEAEDGILCDYIFKDYHSHFKNLIGEYVILFNKIIPIANAPYVGAINSYLMFIPSRLFGINVFSLRLTPILISALTILFIYYFCRMWFSQRMAFISALLTATNLFFVQYSRVGFYREEIFVMFFFWAGLFLLGQYAEKQRSFFLYLSLFLFGLGLSSKITFLFYIMGMLVAWVCLRKKTNLLIGLDIKRQVLASFSFALGSFPMLFYNLKTGGEIGKLLWHSLFRPPINYNNLDYLTNLQQRFHDLMQLLKGYIYERVDWGVMQPYLVERISPVIMGLVLISFVLVLLFVIFSRRSPSVLRYKYRVLFLYVLYVTVFLCTPFTIIGSHPGHLLVLLPFPQIAMAIFLDYIWQKLKQKKVAVITVYALFLIPVLVFNLWMNIYFNVEMKKKGGYRRWSTAICELVDYLQDKRIYTPVTFGFGLKHNIAFLTNYQVIPNQLDENYSLEYVKDEYQRLSLKKEPLFFLTKNSEDYMPNLNLFMKLAKEDNKKKMLHKEFFNSAGEAVYWLYKIY